MMEIRTQTQAGTVAEGAAAPPAYEVHRYPADGTSLEGHDYGQDAHVHTADTLGDAREWIADRIDLALDDARWPGERGDVEAYHQSGEYGCGGYAIRRAEDV